MIKKKIKEKMIKMIMKKIKEKMIKNDNEEDEED